MSLFLVSVFCGASDSTNFANIPPTPSCQGNPGCGGACGGCSCAATQDYCTTAYPNMPGISNRSISKIPLGVEFNNKYSDVSKSCGTVTCDGAETTCQQRHLPAVPDVYLQWSPDVHKLDGLSTKVTCNYLVLNCANCCVSWTCNCFPCPPPPPPPPAP